jgi:SAM-dependent methyltransferase
MPDLSQRLIEDELLDDLHLQGEPLHQTLRDLRKINRLLLNTQAVSSAVLAIISELKLTKSQTITIIDLGCGGGDILIHLAAILKRRNIQAELIGIDGNANSIAFCRERGKIFPNLQFQVKNIMAPEFELPACDILISSHFLYHLGEKGISHFLEQQSAKVNKAIIISELIRSPLAYYLFRFFTPFIGIGQITQQDGMTAIRRAFTFPEMKEIVSRLSIGNSHHYRFLLFRQMAVFRLDR